MKKAAFIAARVCVSVFMTAVPTAAATISVPAGGNLQQAIFDGAGRRHHCARAGRDIYLNFTLPNKGGDSLITIRTANDAGLPEDRGRISPGNAPQLAKIRSGNSGSAIQTAVNAHHWRLMLLEIQANANGSGDIVLLGDGRAVSQDSRWSSRSAIRTATVHGFETQFVSYAGADYHLIAGSVWRGAGTDGADLGALFDQPVGSGASTNGGSGAALRFYLRVRPGTPTAPPSGAR